MMYPYLLLCAMSVNLFAHIRNDRNKKQARVISVHLQHKYLSVKSLKCGGVRI